jgi:outer membrane protein TolC
VPARVSAYDDPTLSWEGWNIPDSLRVDRADNNIFRLAQKIPFPGKRTLAGEIASRDADVAAHSADANALDLVAAVKQAYYDLWEAHEEREIYVRERDLLQRYARVAAEKYAVGSASQSDVLRAQVELTHASSRVQMADLAIDRAAAQLNALRSRPPREPLGMPQSPERASLEATVEELTELAWKNRPEIAGQEAAIARDDAGVRLAERGNYPDFEVSVGRFVNSGRSDGYGAMASVTLPFVYHAKIDAAEDEARARLEVAQSDLRRVRDRVASEVEQLYARARTALLQHEIFYTTHIPQAEEALRVTEAAYQSGASDFLALMDTVRAALAVHLEHLAAQVDFEKAMAELERAVGSEIPRHASGAAEGPHGEHAAGGVHG